MSCPEVELKASLASGPTFRLALKSFDELKPRLVVIILPDHLKVAEISCYLQQILIPLLILLPGPNVAVPKANDRLIALIDEAFETACGARPAAAVDKNLLAHAIMILHILK